MGRSIMESSGLISETVTLGSISPPLLCSCGGQRSIVQVFLCGK